MTADRLDRWADAIDRLLPYVSGAGEAECLDNTTELAEVVREMRHEALELRRAELRTVTGDPDGATSGGRRAP